MTNPHICIQHYDSPCGNIVLASIDNKLCLCDWNDRACAERNKQRLMQLLNADFRTETTAVLNQARKQLVEYFAGTRISFSIPLYPVGTEFQKQVWTSLLEIPYGETKSYKEIALKLNHANGIRAVAQAIGANRINIFIPCHRVVGSNHSLTGYAGGLKAKQLLLETERNTRFPQLPWP